jgi:cytochrome c oxidase assembly protein subunit 15
LTAHLALAFLIFGAMLWVALSLFDPARMPASDRARRARQWACACLGLVFLMVISGGFVAGIRAGFAYNTFPLMNGTLVPPEILMIEPWWKNFFYNMATVQFDHRLLALALVIALPLLWLRIMRTPDASARARVGAHLLVVMLIAQVALGIATLLMVVPLPLAALHQAGAMMLFALALNVAQALR